MDSNHRVDTEWQRELSGVHPIMVDKLAQAGEGWGHAHPLSLYLPSHTRIKFQFIYAPAERADTFTLFHFYPQYSNPMP